MAKRTGEVAQWLTARKRRKTLGAKVQRIQRTLAERKPEMKAQGNATTGSCLNGAVALIELSAIAEGDEGYARDGLQVKLHRVFYTAACYLAGTTNPVAGLDAYLVSVKDTSTPVYADFVAARGGTINKNTFVTWHQHITGGEQNNAIVQNSHSFQFPMKLHFDGPASTTCIKNKTYLVIKNNTGSTVDYHLSYRIWYTDI